LKSGKKHSPFGLNGSSATFFDLARRVDIDDEVEFHRLLDRQVTA